MYDDFFPLELHNKSQWLCPKIDLIKAKIEYGSFQKAAALHSANANLFIFYQQLMEFLLLLLIVSIHTMLTYSHEVRRINDNHNT